MGFSGSLKVTITGHKTPQGKRILHRYGYPPVRIPSMPAPDSGAYRAAVPVDAGLRA